MQNIYKLNQIRQPSQNNLLCHTIQLEFATLRPFGRSNGRNVFYIYNLTALH